jgi:6-phosphogluconolactonase
MIIVKSDKEFKNALFSILNAYSSMKCNLMISGGSLLNYMNDDSYKEIDSTHWNVFFCDERCEKKHSNKEAASGFLRNIRGKIFPIEITENQEETARKYEDILKKNMNGIDICLLGIGENGHICSLWPDSDKLDSSKMVEGVIVDTEISPKRITVTLSFINKFVKNLYFMIPAKNGKPKNVKEPHENIKKGIKIQYETYYME